MLQKTYDAAKSYLIKVNLKVKNIWFFIYLFCFNFLFIYTIYNIQLTNKTSLRPKIFYSVLLSLMNLHKILSISYFPDELILYNFCYSPFYHTFLVFIDQKLRSGC